MADFLARFLKNVFFLFLMVLLIAGTVEVFSFAALSIEAGRPLWHPQLSHFQSEREKILTEYETSAENVPDDIPHPYFGYVFNHEANGKSKYAERRGFPISKFGFIDDKLPVRKRAAGKVVIGIMGGSVAGWFTLHGAEALSQELKKSPAFAGREVEIVRLAHGGYKQPQQLIIFNYLLSLGAEFDYIVNIDGFNEVMVPWVELRPSDVFPFFPRKWNVYASLMYLDPHFIEAAWNYQSAKRRWTSAARLFSRPFIRAGYTANLLWKRLDLMLAEKVTVGEQALRKYRDDKRLFAAQGPEYVYGDGETLFRDAADQWARSSVMMHQTAEKQGISYVHFLQPNQYLPGAKKLTEEEIRDAYRPDSGYREAVERGYPLLVKKAEELRKEGVKYYDLTGLFRDNKESVYIDVCCHMSPEANQEMAREIAARMLETPAPAPGG